jgi:hypothetical protein
LDVAAHAWLVEVKTAWLDLAQKWERLDELADKYAALKTRRKGSREMHGVQLN